MPFGHTFKEIYQVASFVCYVIGYKNGKWFEPRSLSRLCGLIVRVRVVPRRTVVGDIDQRFTNPNGSHRQFTVFMSLVR